MSTVRNAELVQLPQLDRSLSNDRLLTKVCELLLNCHRHLVGPIRALPEEVFLQLFLFGDGFSPRGAQVS